MATINSINNKAGVFTSDTTVTATSGNVILSAGNLALPATGSTRTVGCVTINGVTALNSYGTRNIYVGENAGGVIASDAACVDNVAVGYYAMQNLTAGQYMASCVCVGSYSGYSMYGSAVGSTAVGYKALYSNGNPNYVVALGYQACYTANVSSYTVGIGYRAGYNWASGASSNNVCINSPGVNGEANTLHIGAGTGTSDQQLKTAYISGIYTTAGTPSGTAKVALIDSADLIYGLAGAANTVFVGGTAPSFSSNLSLPYTTASQGIIYIGNTTIHNNGDNDSCFFGYYSGNFSAGYGGANPKNTAIGYGTLYALTGGGTGNSAAGYRALNQVTSGDYNVGAGYEAGFKSGGTGLTTGSYNVLIGYATGSVFNTGSESSNVLINNGGTNNESNALRIGAGTGTGNQQLNSAFISGIYGITSTSGTAVYVNSSDQLGTATSSRDFKEDIQDMGDDSDVLYKLQPRTFKYKADRDPKPKQFGMVAEEVEEVFPEMVVYDKEGKPLTLAYQFLAPMLVNEVQKLQKKIVLLESRLKFFEHMLTPKKGE